MPTHEVCRGRHVWDEKLKRLHQTATAGYNADDTSGDDRKSQDKNTDAGTLPPSPP